LSTLDIDYNNNNNNNSSEEVQLPYQIHRRMMGWKLTNPNRRRDLIGMLDIVHKQSPVDLLMGGSRIQNETLERRSREYEVTRSGSRRRKANFKKIPSLKKLEQQIQYLQDYEKHASTYASAAPGSPLYYLDEVIHSAQQKSMEYGDINKESEAAFDHDLRVRALSPTSMRRQSRAWEQNVNRMLKIRRAYTSVRNCCYCDVFVLWLPPLTNCSYRSLLSSDWLKRRRNGRVSWKSSLQEPVYCPVEVQGSAIPH
jgi:hypothetical protein